MLNLSAIEYLAQTLWMSIDEVGDVEWKNEPEIKKLRFREYVKEIYTREQKYQK